MERVFFLKIGFIILQFFAFGVIFGLQFYYGTSVSFITEWVKAIYCLVLSTIVALSLFIDGIRESIPYLKDEWKLGITVLILSAFGFRSTLTDIRTLISFGLVGMSVCFVIVMCILPESRPDFQENRDIKFDRIDFNQTTDNEIRNYSQNDAKYSNYINTSQEMGEGEMANNEYVN